jgi:predicted Zn-dependent protease
MRLRHVAATVAFVLSGALAGCANLGPVNRQVSLPDAPRSTDMAPATLREHQRILAAYGGAYNDPRMEALLTQTVDRLVASSDRPDLRYKVIILNSPAVNAFALPSGQLYITRGLIELSNDTSEVASVLAHEMAHVIAQHAAIREEQTRVADLVSRTRTDVLNDPETGALALAKSKIALTSFSRAQELEADSIGVGIAARAGYDPYGAARFLASMGRNAGMRPVNSNPRSIEFLSSHPSTPNRVTNAQASARQFTAPGAGERERVAFLAGVEGMIYGEDPSEGFVRGRRFLHPRLGFSFTAPEGFVLDNTAQAVLGIKDGGNQALRLDIVRVPAEQSLAAYLNSGWMDSVESSSVETLTISGFPAATAAAKSDELSFRLYVVRFGSEVYRFIFAAKQMTPPIDRSFRESMSTFRRMSLAERQSAKPLRIKVVTVQPGDTPEKVASRMTIDRPLERFLVLNGLEPGDRLHPGDKVKIVLE